MAIRVPSRARQRKYGYVSTFACGSIDFEDTSVNTISESVVLTVERTGGDHGRSVVEWATQDGTAVAGVNYTAASGTLTWEDGEQSAKTITVFGLDADEDLTFSVVLSVVSGCATVGQGTANVSILTPTKVEVFDSPGTYEWEIDPLADSVEVRLLGGGGGGGGGVGGSGTANTVTGGGGGGGGAGAVVTFAPEDISGPITITIGSGGVGGQGGIRGVNDWDGFPGTSGTASRFGDLVVAGGGGGGGAGEWSGAPLCVGGGGGGGVQLGTGDGSETGGIGAFSQGGTGGSVGGALGGADVESGQIAADAPAPSTDYGGGGGGGGDFDGSRGSVSLWGAPGGGGGSAALNGLPGTESPGANGTASTGATDTPLGGAAHSDGEDGENPLDPLMLAGSSGGGGGGGVGSSGLGPNNGGDGGDGGRGAGGGGGGGIYVGDTTANRGGAGGRGGNGYCVIITTRALP